MRRFHYEVVAEYPNGGKDVVKVWDDPEPIPKVYATDNYKKGDGLHEGWDTYIALVNIARGEELIIGQNVLKQGG